MSYSNYNDTLQGTLSRRSTQRGRLSPVHNSFQPQIPTVDIGLLKANAQRTNQDLIKVTATSKVAYSSTNGLRISVSLNRPSYIATGNVNGIINIECTKAQRLRIGAIKVEVLGFEEVIVGKELYRKLFLWNLQHIQDAINRPDLNPSEPVICGSFDNHGMWQARKGSFEIGFSVPLETIHSAENLPLGRGWSMACFPIGNPIPSSFWSESFGGVKYFVRATVEYKRVKGGLGDTTVDTVPLLLEAYREFQVVETAFTANILDIFQDAYSVDSPLTSEAKGAVSGPKLFGFGKRGQLWVKMYLRNCIGSTENGFELPTAAWISGANNFITLDMANVSERKVTEIKISLIRKLKSFTVNQQAANVLEANQIVDTSQLSPHIIPLQYSERVESIKYYRVGGTKNSGGLEFNNSRKNKPTWREKSRIDEPEDYKKSARVEYDTWTGLNKGQGVKREVSIYVPHTSRTIRGTSLIIASYSVEVLVKPKGSQEIRLEAPILVLQPQSFIKRESNMEPVVLQADGTVKKQSIGINAGNVIGSRVISNKEYEANTSNYLDSMRSARTSDNHRQRVPIPQEFVQAATHPVGAVATPFVATEISAPTPRSNIKGNIQRNLLSTGNGYGNEGEYSSSKSYKGILNKYDRDSGFDTAIDGNGMFPTGLQSTDSLEYNTEEQTNHGPSYSYAEKEYHQAPAAEGLTSSKHNLSMGEQLSPVRATASSALSNNSSGRISIGSSRFYGGAYKLGGGVPDVDYSQYASHYTRR